MIVGTLGIKNKISYREIKKGYTILRNKKILNSFYIVWHKNSYIDSQEALDSAIDFITKLTIFRPKIFEIQFHSCKNAIAIRRVNKNRNKNRIYKRDNPSFYLCKDCLEIVNKDNMYHSGNGGFYCEDCYNKNFVNCLECGRVIRNEGSDIVTVRGKIYCQECFDEKFVRCFVCGSVILRDNANRGLDENLYCEDCFDENFRPCVRCGELCYNEDLTYNENNNEYICHSCIVGESLHEFNYKPEPVFSKEKYENTLYIGMEIEVEIKDSISEMTDELQEYLEKEKIGNRFYCKTDGSLDNGFEVVSHPATLKNFHTSHKLKKILDWLKSNGAVAYDNENPGLHFHLDRKWFTKKDEGKMLLFFDKNWRKIVKFSRRTSERISDFCRKTSFDEDDYCDFLSGNYDLENNRYVAVNLMNDNTIEIRICRGTLDHKRFLASLQFVDAVSNFIKINSFKSLNWDNFKSYLRLTNRYNHLEKHLRKGGI